MKKSVLVFVALAAALPLTAQAQQGQLSKEELIQLAIDENTCEDLFPVDARYDPENATRVIVTCSDAQAIVPAGAAGLGLGGVGAAAAGLALVAAAGGSDNTTTTTTTTSP